MRSPSWHICPPVSDPGAPGDVLRDGHEFGCGDTITFTFEYSDATFDFSITVDVE